MAKMDEKEDPELTSPPPHTDNYLRRNYWKEQSEDKQKRFATKDTKKEP